VLEDQPTEDLAARDPLGPRWAFAWDRPADIARRTLFTMPSGNDVVAAVVNAAVQRT
jgi:hypothetical protein